MKMTLKFGKRGMAVILSIALVLSSLVFTSFAADGDETHVHTYDNGVVTIEPGCFSEGVKTFTCTSCPEGTDGHSYTEPIPAEHIFAFAERHDPTCTQKGYDLEICSRCHQVSRQTNFVSANGHQYVDTRVEVSCTDDGGTLRTCSVCADKPENEREQGWQYLVPDETALGHDMSEYEIVVYGDAYAKKAVCQRADCDYYAYELGADETVNIYYQVRYVNDFAAGTKETMGDGTVLEKAPFEHEFLQTEYVLKGTAVPAYEGDTPERGATVDYGAYSFSEWTTSEGDMQNVQNNMIIHAAFEGIEVDHWVTFYNPDAKVLGDVIWVHHGESASYTGLTPTYAKYPDNYHYVFDRWDIEDLSAIYSNRSVNAIYTPVGKTYKIIYCDYNGAQLDSEVFQYGQAPEHNPTYIDRPEDDTFYYEFSGIWKFKYEAPSGETTEFFTEDYTVDRLITPYNAKCLDCNRGYEYFEYDPANENDDYMSDVEKGIVRVFADYYTRAKLYYVRVTVVDSEGYPVYNAGNIQVLNPDGSLYKTATLGDDASVVLELTYNVYYTIQVSYMGEMAQQTVTLDQRNRDKDLCPNVRIVLGSYSQYQEGDSDSCSCMCHMPLIGRIYIAFLNLIYRLTGRKIVCCPDMYETHADQLVYH